MQSFQEAPNESVSKWVQCWKHCSSQPDPHHKPPTEWLLKVNKTQLYLVSKFQKDPSRIQTQVNYFNMIRWLSLLIQIHRHGLLTHVSRCTEINTVYELCTWPQSNMLCCQNQFDNHSKRLFDCYRSYLIHFCNDEFFTKPAHPQIPHRHKTHQTGLLFLCSVQVT